MIKLSLFKERFPISPDHLRLISDIGSLSLSTVISRLLLFVRDLMLASILGPGPYGVWIQIVVVFNYALHLPLGFQHAMSREVPYFLGKTEEGRARRIQDIAFLVTLATAFITGSVMLAAYTLFGYHPFGLSFFAVLIVVAAVIVQQINGFYSLLLRAHQRFHVFSSGFVMVALLSLLIGVLLAPTWGAAGMAAAQGVSLAAVTVYWMSRTSYRPTLVDVDWTEFRRLAHLAIPLFFVGLSGLLLVSIDRLLMAFFYPAEEIGYYGLAFLMNQSIFLIVTPIVQSLNPRLMVAYGRYQDRRKLKHYLVLLTQVMGTGVALLIGLLYLVIELLIAWVLPEFTPAIANIRVLSLGSTFFALAAGGDTFLVAVNQQNQVLKIQAMVIVVEVIVVGTIAYAGGEIRLIALGMALTYGFYATLSLVWAGTSLDGSPKTGILFGLHSLLPIVYILGCAVLIEMWHVFPTDASDLLRTLLQCFLWLLAVSPAIFYVYRDSVPKYVGAR